MPPEQDVHIVFDNYATHKHEKVRKWLKRNRRVHLHFTPTSSSWLNLVERFFARLSDQRLLRGALTSVCHLEKSIRQYLDLQREPAAGGPGARRTSGRACAAWPAGASARPPAPSWRPFSLASRTPRNWRGSVR